MLLVSEPLAEEVANVADKNKKEISDIGGEKEIIRRFVLDRGFQGYAVRLADIEMARMAERTKLSIGSSLSLHFLGRLGSEQSSSRWIRVGVVTRNGRGQRDYRERGGWRRNSSWQAVGLGLLLLSRSGLLLLLLLHGEQGLLSSSLVL